MWDSKEETFRNYGQLLGPHDDVELVLWCDVDDENDIKYTVVYIDPAYVIAASHDVTVDKDQTLVFHKPDFRKPLRPGKHWNNCNDAIHCQMLKAHVHA